MVRLGFSIPARRSVLLTPPLYPPPQAVADSRMPPRQGGCLAIPPCWDDPRRQAGDTSTFRKFPRFYVQPTQFPPSVNLRFAQYVISEIDCLSRLSRERSFWIADIFARVSTDAFLPVSVTEIFERISSVILLLFIAE